VLLDLKNLNFILSVRTPRPQKPVIDTGLTVLGILDAAEALAVVVEFVVAVVGGVLSA